MRDDVARKWHGNGVRFIFPTPFPTVDGEAYLRAMIGRGEAFIERIIEHMDAEEIVSGIHFFERIRAIVAELDT